MKQLLATIALTLTAAAASAGPTCTAPKDSWKPEAQFQQELKDQGYTIRNFKVTKGQCYEIYGTDKTGKKVEIYFDPASGRAVESK